MRDRVSHGLAGISWPAAGEPWTVTDCVTVPVSGRGLVSGRRLLVLLVVSLTALAAAVWAVLYECAKGQT